MRAPVGRFGGSAGRAGEAAPDEALSGIGGGVAGAGAALGGNEGGGGVWA